MCGCKNVGPIDRAIRLIIGVSLTILAFVLLGAGSGAIGGIIAIAAGAVLLLTAAIGFCPAYLPFKMSTCKVRA